MSTGELFLTLIVALFVFGPNKLPMLARHLAQLMIKIEHYKKKASGLWLTLLNEQTLQENTKKAHEADVDYQAEGSGKKNTVHSDVSKPFNRL